jgi:protein O-mannosyl-transferase
MRRPHACGNEVQTVKNQRVPKRSRRTAQPAPRASAGRTGLLAGLIVAAGALVFGNSLWGPFIYDDAFAIVRNPRIQQLWPLWDALHPLTNTPLAGRPMVSLSFAVNYALGGLDVRGYHAFNIAVHIFGALALFGIVRRTLLREPLRQRFGQSSAGIAAASALIWMTHPLQTEAVNYLTQRTESVMGLFYLLTIYAAIRAHEPGSRLKWAAVSIAACGAGMASKESMVSAPLMVALYDWAFRTGPVGPVLRERWRLYAGLAVTWVLLAVLIWSGPRSGTVGFSTAVGPLTYAMNQCVMIVRYVRLAVWPSPLVLDYGYPQPLTAGAVAPYAVVVAILLVATIVALRFRPAAGFLGAWFFVILAPTSSIVPIASEVGAERRMYLPLAGLVVLLVTLGYVLIDRVVKEAGEDRAVAGFRSRTRAVLVSVLVVALGWTSASRNAEYRSPERIWRSVLAVRPSWRVQNNLGMELSRQGRYAEAIDHYREALRDQPDSLEIHYNLAHDLEFRGAIPEAITEYRAFLRLEPDEALVHNILGTLLARQGSTDEAIAHYREALRLRPDFADPHGNLGDALLAQRKFEEAADEFTKFLQVRPDEAGVHNNVGLALAQLERPDEAIAHYRRAVELRPDFAEAQFNLGLALTVTGRRLEGREHLRAAARLNPAMARDVGELTGDLPSSVDDGATRPLDDKATGPFRRPLR